VAGYSIRCHQQPALSASRIGNHAKHLFRIASTLSSPSYLHGIKSQLAGAEITLAALHVPLLLVDNPYIANIDYPRKPYSLFICG
jgi:hypothetical protein